MFNEKVAYLKGLQSGLALEGDSKEQKLIAAIIDALDELTEEMTDLRDDVDELEETLDEIEDSFEDLSEFLGNIVGNLEDDDDDDDGIASFPHLTALHAHDETEPDDEEDGQYEITCPGCERTFVVSEEVLFQGGVACPGCKERLTFDMEGCDCGGGCSCEHKHGEEAAKEKSKDTKSKDTKSKSKSGKSTGKKKD